MKKLIKLLILAAVLIGAVVGLMYIIAPDNGEDKGPLVSSPTANEWKEQINKLCEKGKWNAKGYNAIETGIHTDRVTSEGELISLDEENALQKYLFTASCNSLNKQVDELFKQSSYPASAVKSSDEMLAFLNGKLENFGSDSNLTESSNILSEYHQLMGCVSFSGSASYSHPLREFDAMTAEAAQNRVKSLKYYNSHFSKNPTIMNLVNNVLSNRAKAESDYYMNLEKAVENHYKSSQKSSQDFEVLLDDQIRFNQISTNSNAKSMLNSFVNNPNR